MTGLFASTGLMVVGFAAAAWQLTRTSRRRERLAAFAIARGWTFEMADPTLLHRWFGPPFGRGERPEATAVVRGIVGGRPMTAFEYTYETVRDQDNHFRAKQRFSIVVIETPAFLPSVTVMPERRFGRLETALGTSQDIELESEAFNRAFRVTARNARAASDLLPPRTMQMLLSRPPFTFRVEGRDIVSWQPGGLEPMDLFRRATTMDAFADGIPDFVWADHGYPGEG